MAEVPTKAKKAPSKNRATKRAVKKAVRKVAKKAVKSAEGLNDELGEDDRDELEGRDFSALVKQVQSEHTQAWWFIKPKWDEWALRLKLYNNQKRDKEAVGDTTLFTIFQTVLASLYNDQLAASFAPRESGDDEVAENLDITAEFDHDEMEKDILDYEWDWETMFFGRGLVAMMDFDRERMVPVPELWNVMTVLRDPQAKSINGDRRGRGRARFLYREVRMTKDEMEDMGVYFNFKSLKPTTTSTRSLVDENMRVVAEAAGLSDATKFESTDGDNATYRLLEGFTRVKGKLVFVTLADEMKKVVRYHELKGKDIPMVDRAMFPIPNSWDGVSIPDLVEDKQRARAVALNLSLKSVKSSLHPMYLFDSTRVTNRADLNFEFNKFIPVNGNTNGAVTVMPKDSIKQDVQYIMDTLSMSAERSTATPDIQQGGRPDEAGTATRDALIAQKVDTRYSLAAKVFGWSERRFWKAWYALYKEHFKDGIDEKNVRIVGALGAKWRPFTRENLVAGADPDVKIESKAVSEAKRFNQLQLFRGWAQMVAPIQGANIRFMMKYMGKLSGLHRDIIDQSLPQTIEEIRAEEENERLRNDELVEVTPYDDHATHMEIHNKMEDTPAKYAHINAHKRAMLLQRARPDLFPPEAPAASPEALAQGGLPSPTAETNGKGRVMPA
mgnify:FL=1